MKFQDLIERVNIQKYHLDYSILEEITSLDSIADSEILQEEDLELLS